ncbi:tyrosine phosphatase family-domain-containing protein [Aspergillus karnatakaensis]|uniref:tyrosine phosphatase family protein n=1 Tax=Aspergillus karnatakaensis TaxID=1810916 RepID=UPI003CCE44F0
MSYPLSKKSTNSVNENPQAEKQAARVPSLDSVESDVGKTELPENFGEVVEGIYRSSFPQPCYLPALKSLGLKSIITLVEEPYTPSHASYLKENGITHHRIAFIANKDPLIKTSEVVINQIMEILLNKLNHPILIHCNKGKHRTGCVTGCFRKLQGWDMRDIINEYLHYSRPKQRKLDEDFIQSFDTSKLAHLAQASGAKSWPSSGKKYANTKRDEDESSPENLPQPSYSRIRVT